MLATFCVRLALGLFGSLILLLGWQPHPRFNRTHFLTALGLLVVAVVASWAEADFWLKLVLVSATLCCLAGALSWTLEPAPLGRTLVALCGALCLAAMCWLEPPIGDYPTRYELPVIGWVLVGASSAALLGSALTAMLVGHSYLISPGLTIRPLMVALVALAVALAVRAAVNAGGLACWTADGGTYKLNSDTGLWLPVRWLVGLIAPIGFGWMAYASARIRSTQSATGILYVVDICVFLGELLSLLLTRQTGLPL